uniref:Secreted protein n=1 Tax=Oryza brachyantha TaxID=4533 RepID=J3LQV3_ORYBR
MTNDFLNFLSHLLLFGSFNFCNLSHRVYSDTRAIYLDFVCVHSCVCNQNFSILNSLWLPKANFLVKNEPFIQKGVLEGSSRFLQNL